MGARQVQVRGPDLGGGCLERGLCLQQFLHGGAVQELFERLGGRLFPRGRRPVRRLVAVELSLAGQAAFENLPCPFQVSQRIGAFGAPRLEVGPCLPDQLLARPAPQFSQAGGGLVAKRGKLRQPRLGPSRILSEHHVSGGYRLAVGDPDGNDGLVALDFQFDPVAFQRSHQVGRLRLVASREKSGERQEQCRRM